MTRYTYFTLPLLVFAFLFPLISCTKNESKVSASNPPQKYSLSKISLGASAQILKEKHVRWLGGEVTIDDAGNIYVLAGSSILVFNNDGSLNKEIFLNDVTRNISDFKRIGPIEVSGDGRTVYVRLEKGNNVTYHLYNSNGDLLSSKEETGLIRKTGNDLFQAVKYSAVKHEIIATEMYVLDKELKITKNLNNYYMTNIRLNERPLGFFDSALNFFYVSNMPPITKLDPNGKVVWQRNVQFRGENWQLIGIDKDANLYAKVSTGNNANILKLDQNVNVLAVISIEELQKDSTALEGIVENEDWVRSFRVNHKGTVFFIANMGTVYKFEQSKQQ
jgi:DNA-binding beta-propeller fold protein YncE